MEKVVALTLCSQPSVLKHHFAAFWGLEVWLGEHEVDEEIGEELTLFVGLTETRYAGVGSGT